MPSKFVPATISKKKKKKCIPQENFCLAYSNSENNCLDTIILACEKGNGWKGFGFNAHLNALTVPQCKTWQVWNYNYLKCI